MARLRNFVCYRDHNRPYTRISKYKKLSYIRSKPANRIARYTTGKQEAYPFRVHLVTKDKVQIRDNAIESARLATVRTMEKVLGKAGFFYQMRIFPHHVLRENPLASGAGADRLSTGMAHSFGKAIGIAAQVRPGQELFTLHVPKENVPLARTALKNASKKLPCRCTVIVVELDAKKPTKKAVAKTPKKEVAEVPKKEVAEVPKKEVAEIPEKEIAKTEVKEAAEQKA